MKRYTYKPTNTSEGWTPTPEDYKEVQNVLDISFAALKRVIDLGCDVTIDIMDINEGEDDAHPITIISGPLTLKEAFTLGLTVAQIGNLYSERWGENEKPGQIYFEAVIVP